MLRIKSFSVLPVAAPPTGFGGDARNIAQGGPTYANVYLQLFTNDPAISGTSIIFTNGHGLRQTCEVVQGFARRLLLDKNNPIEIENLHLNGNFGKLSKQFLQDSDYCWLGGVGISRMAIGAVINALWDLSAKINQLPAWQLIVDMAPEDMLAFVDFEHIGDVLPPDQALAILQQAQDGKAERIQGIFDKGLLAYNTAGWSGISNADLVEQTKKMLAAAWPQIKIKVGASYSEMRLQADAEGKVLTRKQLDDLAIAAAKDDIERMLLVYQTIDKEDRRPQKMLVSVDSNQVFDPRSAFIFIKHLAEGIYQANPEFKINWFEEPTNQHSAIGHLQIQNALNKAFKHCDPPLRVPISTGEQGASPVFFKDVLFACVDDIPAQEASFIDVIQMDYSRVAGIGDNIAILLLAQQARLEGRDVRICPHTGGIGLCEGMRNVQAIKQALFGSANKAGVEDILEFVAEETRSVHEGVFANPAIVKNGYYQMSTMPGVGVDYTEEGLANYQLPEGKAWQATDHFKSLARQFMLLGD